MREGRAEADSAVEYSLREGGRGSRSVVVARTVVGTAARAHVGVQHGWEDACSMLRHVVSCMTYSAVCMSLSRSNAGDDRNKKQLATIHCAHGTKIVACNMP